METTNTSEHIPYVYNYQRNDKFVKKDLTRVLSVDRERLISKEIEKLGDKKNVNRNDILKIRNMTLEFYKQNKIPKYFIDKNQEELDNLIGNDQNIGKDSLKQIEKILKGHRYNFNGIVLEEGKCKGEKTLTRHLEGGKIDIDTMRNSLINGIIFYEKYFPKLMLEIKSIKSGSRLRNKEIIELENQIRKSTDKTNREETLERTENILKAENLGTEESLKNDKFLRIPITNRNKIIKKKFKGAELDQHLEKIFNFLKQKEITKSNIISINLEELNKAREEEQRIKKPETISQINTTLIARYLLNKPIPDQNYLIPIKSIKETEKELYQKKKIQFDNLKNSSNSINRKNLIEGST